MIVINKRIKIMIIEVFVMIILLLFEMYIAGHAMQLPGWNFLEVWFCFLHGNVPYQLESRKAYEMPWSYFLIVLIFLQESFFIQQEIKARAVLVIPRYQSRIRWFMHKLLESVCMDVILWGVFIGIIAVIASFQNGFSPIIHIEHIKAIAGIQVLPKEHLIDAEGSESSFVAISETGVSFSVFQIICMMLIPFLIYMAISIISLVLTIRWNYLIGMIVPSSLMIISAFTSERYLIGNYCMLQRYYYFGEQAIVPQNAIVITSLMIVVSVLYACQFLKKKDIL